MPSSSESVVNLQKKVLTRLFGEKAYHYDLKEGTVRTASNMRMIYLSSDIIRGIYKALLYEAGEAWSIILKSCGYLWGKNVYVSLENDLKLFAHQDMGQLSVTDYIALIEQYFVAHGWGDLKVHLDDAQSYGIVRVSLRHSLFVETLEQVNQPVDALIEGMLHSFFERVSGQTGLGCLEVCCAAQGHPQCEFLISGEARLENIQDHIDTGADFDTILQALRVS